MFALGVLRFEHVSVGVSDCRLVLHIPQSDAHDPIGLVKD